MVKDMMQGVTLELITTLIYIFALVWIEPSMAYVIAPWSIFNIFIFRYGTGMLQRAWEKHSENSRKFDTTFKDYLMNIWNIKYLRLEGQVNDRIIELFNMKSDSLNEYERIHNNIKKVYPFTLVAVLFLYILYRVQQGGIKNKIFVLLIVFQIFEHYIGFFSTAMEIYSHYQSSSSICKTWSETPEILHSSFGRKIDGGVDRIVFNDICYSYSSSSKPVLDSCNFTLKRGETTALVGTSGCGKSTITQLLFRLVNPTSGDIRLNDISIKDLSLCQLREKIGIVPQRIILFNEKSVLENILVNESQSDESRKGEIRELIELVELEGVNLSKKASDLSLGQKQRVFLIRVLFQNPEIYIFDEYLSSVDPDAAIRIHSRVVEYIGDAISIFILHNHELKNACNRVLTMKNGRIHSRPGV